MRGWLFDMLLLLTAVIWLVKLTVEGLLTTDQSTFFLVSILVLVAISRIMKVGVARLIFRLGIPVCSLLIFASTYSNGHMDQMLDIMGAVFTLLVVLFGIYIMIVGPFRRGK